MGLSLSLHNAVSGLNASQQGLSTLSQNIANVNTDNYSRQVVYQEAQYIENVGTGVRVEEIIRQVDQFMITATQRQGSEVGKLAVVDEYMQRVQLLLGAPGDDSDLTAYVDNFFNAMQDLADNPELSSMRQALVGSAVILADQVSSLARGLENLRYQADQDIAESVDIINEEIDHLYELNKSFYIARTVGNNISGLLDERDVALQRISELVNLKVTYEDNGAVSLYTADGRALLDDGKYRLDYQEAISPDVFINDSGINPVTVIALDVDGDTIGSPEELIGAGTEGSIDTSITGGKVLGLLQIRDIELPKMLAELDQFAATLREEINAIHNDGAGFPPPDQLIGTREVASTDTSDWTGEFRMAVLDSSGEPIENIYGTEEGGIRPLTLDLAGLDLGYGRGRQAVGDIVDEINAHFGAPQKKIHLNNLNDIRLVSLTENSPAGPNFSFDFDFENISDAQANVNITNIAIAGGALTSPLPSGPYGVAAGAEGRTGLDFTFDATLAGPATISIDFEVTNLNTGLIETATIQFNVDPALTGVKNDRYIGTATVGTAVEEMPTSFTRFAFAQLVDENGTVVSAGNPGYLRITTERDGYVLAIDELDSAELGRVDDTPPLEGTDRGFSHYFELNNFFVRNDTITGSAINMEVRSDIIANPNFISSGELVQSYQPVAAGAYPDYSYALGKGSNAVAQRMAELATQQVVFDPAGAIPESNLTLTAYSSTILGEAAARSSTAEQSLSYAQLLFDGYNERAEAASGVNLDEELANTIIYQNAYTASARVITTVNELFDTLLNTV